MVNTGRHIAFFVTAFSLLCTALVSAQSLTLSCSDDTISTDDQFVIVVNGELSNFTSYATLPDVPGLITISHSESFNYNSSNKAATVRQTYTMKAINAGDYIIQPAWIQSGSRRIYSNMEHIHVKAGDNPASNGMVFMRAEPSKSTVYAGEKVNVRLYLYSSYDYTVSGDYPTATSYSGFWAATDPDFVGRNDTAVTIKGRRFRRQTIHSEFLYPNATGVLALPEYTYSCYLSKYNDDAYNWDSYDVSIDLKSEPSTITVLDLPPHDTLPGYAGDVGQYSIKSKISDDSTRCWEPVIYTMYVTGNGNFQFMITPQLSLPPGLRAQNIRADDSSTFEYDYYDDYDYKATETGKVYQYLITPEKEGTYDLSAIAFSYFDPNTAEYVTLHSDSFRLHVAPGDSIPPDTVNNLPGSFFEKKGAKQDNATITFVCILLVLLPVSAYVFYRYRKKQKLKMEEAEKEAARIAALSAEEYVAPPDTSLEQANALIHGAGQYLQTGHVVPAVNNLYEALIVRISGITRMRREEISMNSLRYKLKMAQLSDELTATVMEQYEDLMLKRYTMTATDIAAVHVLIVRTADLIQKMR